MQRDQMRQIVSDTVQKSLAESGTVLSAIPAAQLNGLINALSDGMFAAISAVEDENEIPSGRAESVTPASLQAADPQHITDEKLLWRGRPYLTIGVIYELTSQRLRILRGILGNQIEEVELIRVRDTKVKQHMGERLFDVGDITVISADSVTPSVMLNNVRNPVEVRELIRKAVQVERQRRGMSYREVLEDHDPGPDHN